MKLDNSLCNMIDRKRDRLERILLRLLVAEILLTNRRLAYRPLIVRVARTGPRSIAASIPHVPR